jgi:hypothetical protein
MWPESMRELPVALAKAPLPIPHLCLGDAPTVTTLRVEWPSGIVRELGNVAAERQGRLAGGEDPRNRRSLHRSSAPAPSYLPQSRRD